MSHSALRYSIAAAFLLQACAAPAPRALDVRPAMQVTHASNETAEAFYQLGRQHHAQGDLDVAMTGYTYAIARDPRHLAARSAAASIHAQQGRLDQARAMMLAVVADYPANSQAHNNLGYIEYLRGDHAGAAREIRRALALDARNERARNNLALAEAGLAPVAAAAAPQPAVPVMPAPPVPAAVHPGQMALVQVVPNIYELRRPTVPAPVIRVAQMERVVQEAALPAAAMPGSRIEVVNGDGSAGLARRVGTLLGQHGYRVARLANERPFGQRTTRIQYRPGYVQQAEALRALIEGRVQLAPVQSLAANADLRIVLGRDTQRALASGDAKAAMVKVAAR